MTDSDADRDPVESLAAEFVQRLRSGEHPSVEEYAAKYGEWSDTIHELFPTIAKIEQLKLHKQRSGCPTGGLGPIDIERLGDFCILREIGRGGMGIVYEAEQESLGRRVAVKVLPKSALLNGRQVQRFQREAQMAARLHHTNIVPVFGVGEQQGFHYIVMPLIHGVGLDKILAALTSPGAAGSPDGAKKPEAEQPAIAPPVEDIASIARKLVEREKPAAAAEFRPGPRYWQSIARIGVQAAGALDYAHERGTLHRDVKPANLLVDREGVLVVTDFGLAKMIEHDTVSRTGEVAGTLRYMPPERFHGEGDARSDVYSLGLTLYELIALRPAHEGSTPGSLMRKITCEDPSPPRLLQPEVPKDLETIVLKAISREPAARYGTAAELAADLECFLEDRPIRARRISPLERGWRWCRRNPTVAGLTATAVALLVAVAAATTVGYVRTSRANARVQLALEGQSQQREKAEVTSGLALEALDNIFEQFAPDRIAATPQYTILNDEGEPIQVPSQPVLSKEAAALLEELLVFYDRLADQGGDDPQIRQKAAEANRRLGDINQRLGRYDYAAAAYRQAIALYEQMQSAGKEADPDSSARIARIHNELGSVALMAGRPEEAQAFYQQALAILLAAGDDAAGSPRNRYELARTYYLLGKRPGRETGPPAGPGRRRGREAVSREKAGSRGKPAIEKPAEARESSNEPQYLREAIDLLRALAAEYPSTSDYRYLLALCYREPTARSETDKLLAPDPLQKATDILAALVDEFPAVPDYRYSLCETLMVDPRRVGRSPTDDEPADEQRLHKALDLAEGLVAAHPNVPDYVSLEVQIQLKISHLLRDAGRDEDAEAALRQALALQSSLLGRFSEVASYGIWLAVIQESLAKMLRSRDQLTEARSLLERSIVILKDQLAGTPEREYVDDLLSRHSATLADVVRRMSDKHAAGSSP
jgi:serine/threonine protein kinase